MKTLMFQMRYERKRVKSKNPEHLFWTERFPKKCYRSKTLFMRTRKKKQLKTSSEYLCISSTVFFVDKDPEKCYESALYTVQRPHLLWNIVVGDHLHLLLSQPRLNNLETHRRGGSAAYRITPINHVTFLPYLCCRYRNVNQLQELGNGQWACVPLLRLFANGTQHNC